MIYNKSRGKTVSKKCIFCRSSFSKALGLMFSIKPKSLVFVFEKEKIVPLHMFFVFFPIDVVYLDKKRKVVEIKEDFMPFTFYNPKKRAAYVVELPKGSVKSSNTKIGDVLRFNTAP